MVLVTVYVPGWLKLKSMAPVAAFRLSPAGAALKVPALPPPENVGRAAVAAPAQ